MGRVPAVETQPIVLSAQRGRIVGRLAPGEDVEGLQRALVHANEWITRGERAVLGVDAGSGERAQRERAAVLAAIKKRRRKRYTFIEPTSSGARVIKIAEVQSTGNVLLGLMQSSTARREHDNHARAQQLDLAATETKGFLEWRLGPRLVRALQVQTVLDPTRVSLSQHLTRELSLHGDAALDAFADALAAMHATPFFHADLKGFHGFVTALTGGAHEPSTYRLQWIDFGRVSFRLSPRQRIINLYQALRFVVPLRPEAQERFITRYTYVTGWHRHSPGRALARVRDFLAYKLVTHPIA